MGSRPDINSLHILFSTCIMNIYIYRPIYIHVYGEIMCTEFPTNLVILN